MEFDRVACDAFMDAGVAQGLDLDAREAAALRAALWPWLQWMRRPEFTPRPDEDLEIIARIQDGIDAKEPPMNVVALVGPDGRDSGWTLMGADIIPPAGHRGVPPRWIRAMTRNPLNRVLVNSVRYYWDSQDGRHEQSEDRVRASATVAQYHRCDVAGQCQAGSESECTCPEPFRGRLPVAPGWM